MSLVHGDQCIGSYGETFKAKLAVTFYQGHHDRNHKLRNIVYTETYESAAGMLLYINGNFINFAVIMLKYIQKFYIY
jgi:cation transporter-like permease